MPPFFLSKPPSGVAGGGTDISGLFRRADPVDGLLMRFNGWEPGQIVTPPAGAHAHFNTEIQNPANVAYISMREPQHMTEVWNPGQVDGPGVARSESPFFFSYDPVLDGCKNLNNEAAFTAVGREEGFAGYSHVSGRQQRALPGALNWANGDRRVSYQIEFRIGNAYDDNATAVREEANLPNTGTGWNGNLKLFTIFKSGGNGAKLFEFLVAWRGEASRGWCGAPGIRYYGMAGQAIAEIDEPNVVSENQIEVLYPEDGPDGGDVQPGGDTRLLKGLRRTYTAQDHLDMAAGDNTKPFLIHFNRWTMLTMHYEFLDTPSDPGSRVALKLYLSDEVTPAKLVMASRATPGQGLIFDTAPNGGGPFTFGEWRVPEHNSSGSGNHANTIWTPVESWYRNMIIRGGDDSFINQNWQPIGPGG